MVGVDSDEEVTEVEGNLLAVLETGKSLTVGTVLKNCGKELYEHSVAVALVACALFAGAAESAECALTLCHILESVSSLANVCSTLFGYESACGSVLVKTCVVLELTVLVGGGSAVKVEVEGLIGGNAESEGVGTEHTLYAEGRSNGGTSVGTGKTDTALRSSHGGVVACDTVVAGVTNSNHTHTVLLSLIDSHLHSLVTDNLTHTVMSVNNSGGLGLLDDLKIGYGVLNTCLDSVKVDRLETVAAVGLDTALVGFEKNVCADLRVLAGNAVAYERVNYKVCDCGPIDDVFCHD